MFTSYTNFNHWSQPQALEPCFKKDSETPLDWEQQSSMITGDTGHGCRRRKYWNACHLFAFSGLGKNISLGLNIVEKRWALTLHSNLNSKNEWLYASVQIVFLNFTLCKVGILSWGIFATLVLMGPDWRQVLRVDLKLLSQEICGTPGRRARRS